jgi:two-component system, NtrC family, sensor histidine kinase HydH
VVLGIKVTDEEIVGLLILQDERVADAFSADEIVLLEVLAPLVSVVIENSRTYARMKERDRLAALGQMAAGLAHEIKNPLGSIKGAAQLLLDGTDGPLPPTSRDFLDIIIEEVDRLDRVVGSALDYARPREGDPVPLDVNAVVRRTMQILGPAATNAVQIDYALEEDLPRVRVDAEQLRQVLMNLVYNGLHAMGSRGTLTISTRRRRGALAGWHRQDLGADSPGWVEISVKDTGQGISPKILNNLFVPFFSTKSKGTGLGLAISQRIVQAAGGSIEVTTQEGTGSTFTVVLPASGRAHQDDLATAEASAVRDAPPAEPRSTSN